MSRQDGTVSTSVCSKTAPIESAAADLAYLASLSQPPRGGRIFGEVFSQRQPGRMFDDDERRPVRGVRVTVAGPVRRSTTTDADGRFAIDSLPAGRYTLTSAAPPGLTRLDASPPETLVLPHDRACAERRLFYERPRR